MGLLLPILNNSFGDVRLEGFDGDVVFVGDLRGEELCTFVMLNDGGEARGILLGASSLLNWNF